jgi:ribonuclease H / adenosylcobalamin/alpha-ribazole phosphatase
MNLVLEFDGSSLRNPGHAGCAFVLRDAGSVLNIFSKYLGVTTNNVAEYEGLIAGLEFINSLKQKINSVCVRGDSLLVINQMKRRWAVKSTSLLTFYNRAKHLAELIRAKTPHIKFEHHVRSHNQVADNLAKAAAKSKHN